MARIVRQPNTTPSRDQTVAWGTFEATDFGTLWLVWSRAGIRRLSFDRLEDGYTVAANQQPIPDGLQRTLTRYFAGEPEDFTSIDTDLRGTEFQQKVWTALRRIPWGEVRSYGHVAKSVEAPRAVRAVGAANGANPVPIIVPCHRVVEASSALGGYSGGTDRKRRLLEIEGAHIQKNVVQPGQLSLF